MNKSIVFAAVLLVAMVLAVIPGAEAADWRVVVEKDIGKYLVDYDSCRKDAVMSEKLGTLVVAADLKYQPSPFGAGVAIAVLQGVQRDHKDIYPGVDFSRFKYLRYKAYVDIRNDRITVTDEAFYDTTDRFLAKAKPKKDFGWTQINFDTDDGILARSILGFAAEQVLKR